MGARRAQLLLQHGLEATLYAVVAGILSSALVAILLSEFNRFTGKSIALGNILTLPNIGIFAGFVLALGILSGAYPAMLITSFKPLMALKGLSGVRYGKLGRDFRINTRQILVGVQYILSIGLIMISLVIQKQYNFLQQRDLGFSKENLLVIPLTSSLVKDYKVTRAAFMNQNKNLHGCSAYLHCWQF